MEYETAEPAGRWTRRKNERPGEILDAALRVFAAKGFAAARMEDIAKAAGVTKGTIYLYYENKEQVFKSLVLELIGGVMSGVETHVGTYQGPVSDLLRFVLKNIAVVMIHSDRIALPKIIIAEAGNFPALAEFWKREVIDRGMGILGKLMQRGIESGEFRALPTDHMVRLLIAPMLLSAIWRTTFEQFEQTPFDYQAFVETHLDVFLRGVSP
ncbi:MAG TPA: TetR/AcrR family transcriptional regulator [Rhizomicrobium sp.]|nr:TetR/AcrR family transcriptional regulator [Rhizomicrobium sp.]